MRATNTERRRRLPWQKRVADLCTAARGPLAAALVWLGIDRGKDGIQLALLLLLAAATLDTLDGYFARLSPAAPQTWIGAHDLLFDVLFSAALLLYLGLAGYLAPWLVAAYAIFWIAIFWMHTVAYIPAVFFQAPIYAAVVLAAIFDNVNRLVWLAIWVAVMLIFAGRRFFRVRVPTFLAGLSRGRRNSKRHFVQGSQDYKQMQK